MDSATGRPAVLTGSSYPPSDRLERPCPRAFHAGWVPESSRLPGFLYLFLDVSPFLTPSPPFYGTLFTDAVRLFMIYLHCHLS